MSHLGPMLILILVNAAGQVGSWSDFANPFKHKHIREMREKVGQVGSEETADVGVCRRGL